MVEVPEWQFRLIAPTRGTNPPSLTSPSFALLSSAPTGKWRNGRGRVIPSEFQWDRKRILNFQSGVFDHSATLPAEVAGLLCLNSKSGQA
jgi:hypothetical protein